jgi:transcriptional regulator of acetoin/glycerol metabolism
MARKVLEVPLNQLRRTVLECIDAMTLAEVANLWTAIEKGAVLGGGGVTPSLDRVARDVVAITGAGKSNLQQVEKAVIAHALATSGGNVSATAKLVGLERKSVERKIRKYGLKRR